MNNDIKIVHCGSRLSKEVKVKVSARGRLTCQHKFRM